MPILLIATQVITVMFQLQANIDDINILTLRVANRPVKHTIVLYLAAKCCVLY